MSTLRTAGELRGFLADILIGVQSGAVDTNKASAIAKVAAQINQSLICEVNTALQLERMGKGRPVAGSMVIAQRSGDDEMPSIALGQTPMPPMPTGKVWCEQCDMNVDAETASGCKSAHCKAK